MVKSPTIIGALAAVITVAALAFAAIQDREQRRMIAEGLCDPRHEAWYQPPPTSICTAYSAEGSCLMWHQHQDDPYLRTFWVCRGGETFWRRKVYQ